MGIEPVPGGKSDGRAPTVDSTHTSSDHEAAQESPPTPRSPCVRGFRTARSPAPSFRFQRSGERPSDDRRTAGTCPRGSSPSARPIVPSCRRYVLQRSFAVAPSLECTSFFPFFLVSFSLLVTDLGIPCI